MKNVLERIVKQVHAVHPPPSHNTSVGIYHTVPWYHEVTGLRLPYYATDLSRVITQEMAQETLTGYLERFTAFNIGWDKTNVLPGTVRCTVMSDWIGCVAGVHTPFAHIEEQRYVEFVSRRVISLERQRAFITGCNERKAYYADAVWGTWASWVLLVRAYECVACFEIDRAGQVLYCALRATSDIGNIFPKADEDSF